MAIGDYVAGVVGVGGTAVKRSCVFAGAAEQQGSYPRAEVPRNGARKQGSHACAAVLE